MAFDGEGDNMVGRRLLGQQMKSALRSWQFLVVLLLSLMIIGIQWWSTFGDGDPGLSQRTFFRYMLLYNVIGTGTELYLLVFPFLASLLGGTVLSKERLSGRAILIRTRIGWNRQLNVSVISGFLLGALGGSLPMLINLVCAVAICPRMGFVDGVNITDENPFIYGVSWIYPLYKTSQILFIIATILIIAVFSGLFAVLSVTISLFTKRRFVEVMVPFLAGVIVWVMPIAAPQPDMFDGTSQLHYLFFACANEPNCVPSLVVTLLVLLVADATLYMKGKTCDVV